MYNPLLENPAKMKNEDLEKRISDLTKKYFIAANFGHGNICGQIAATIEFYKEEQRKRFSESNQKIIKNQNQNLEDYINIDS
jgi:hypothetical protein